MDMVEGARKMMMVTMAVEEKQMVGGEGEGGRRRSSHENGSGGDGGVDNYCVGCGDGGDDGGRRGIVVVRLILASPVEFCLLTSTPASHTITGHAIFLWCASLSLPTLPVCLVQVRSIFAGSSV